MKQKSLKVSLLEFINLITKNSMQKICEKCCQPFECNMENIMKCQCYGIEISLEAKQLINDNYFDCLCFNCLTHFNDKK